MQAAIKEDIGFSSTLRLPGECISTMDQPNTDEITGNVHQRKKTPTRKSKKLPFIEPSLADRTHVFVCHDTAHNPLPQTHYDGPVPLLQRHVHAFEIEQEGKRDSVTIDPLKAAFWTLMFPDDPAMPRPQIIRTFPTTQGRHTSFPNPCPPPATARQAVRPVRDAPSPWTDTDRRRPSASR